ncbi:MULTISPECIES: hypothetical protein [Yersinia pseudotuberculosis complex]|uniref:Phage-like protein n=1 Tax=Yersinia wautersii TaxID=1341643 RepID=A0ABM9TKI8_9GAMM|nr:MULTISPECIES: hypothetical protein [Yersinia pseudotuberculosis complex]CRG52476.1 phage-like protein [Yersinia wautersii]CRY70210.1 phage-like protein [Yersinia pseudotuberculosis]
MHALTIISRHSSAYRGFVITHRPRTAINPITRYEVFLGEQSFGLLDAQALATGFIDQLYIERKTGAAA